MKPFLIQVFALITTTTSMAVDLSPQPALTAAKSEVAKINLGMTRKEVEIILGPAWEPGLLRTTNFPALIRERRLR